jgi:hypothetical protein
MSKAYFYVLPYAAVVAQEERYLADQATETRLTDRGREPMCCLSSFTSWDSLGKDPTQLVLAHLHWGKNWVCRERFEAQPGVIALGEPWEPVPAAAIPVLEACRAGYAALRAQRVAINGASPVLAPTRDPAVAIDATHSVADALRKANPIEAHELFG